MKSLSRKLLYRVLSIYFVLTLVVTGVQIMANYLTTKHYITAELQTIRNTFASSLMRAIWELNMRQAESIADGLLAMPMVEGVLIRDENEDILISMGKTADLTVRMSDYRDKDDHKVQSSDNGLFGFTFPLVFEFSNRTTLLGDVTVYSSRDIIINRIEIGVYILIGNAIIKTAFLVFLLLMAFNKLLTKPLEELTKQITELDLESPRDAKVYISYNEQNELTQLENSFNHMLDRLSNYREGLESVRKELVKVNKELDDKNINLEHEVAKQTANLSRTLRELDKQKTELESNQSILQAEIVSRREAQHELQEKSDALERSVNELQSAQNQLVESEKMASLGGLVAGVAHEINTPVGVSVTAATYLEDRLVKLEEAYQQQTLTQSNLEGFLKDAHQCTQLMGTNLHRAAELISSFKQVAVDQTNEIVRSVNLSDYLREIIRSLHPKLSKTPHKVHIECPEELELNLKAGAVSQIVTNLVMNSLIHGLEGMDNGEIKIQISDLGESIRMEYSDNGKGMSEEDLKHLFEPFYTTRRGQGGSGLGTHILYNLVTQSLKGKISVESALGKGLSYFIFIPKKQD